MIINLGYYSKTIKNIIVVILTILFLFLSFRLAIFYVPFLIAFIISLIIEPAIKKVSKWTNLTRKTSSIIVLIVTFGIIIGLLAWGVTVLVQESSNLLSSLNKYIDTTSVMFTNFTKSIDMERFKILSTFKELIQNSSSDIIGTISGVLRNILNSILNVITKIPTIAIYTVITFIAIYFLVTDRIYILDQLEYHFPKSWVRKFAVHLREITGILGAYLKAEVILVFISFLISLVGLYIFKFMGLKIEFPLLAAIGIGFVDALPILGSGTVMVPWGIISGINGDWKLGVYLIVLWIIMSIVKQFIEPKIVSSKIGIHPIFTLIAMYTGYKLIGVMGMFLGPIILIILKSVFGTLIDKGIVKTILDKR